MRIGSLGDMAQSFAMQTRNSALKNDIQKLTLELASGKVSDVREAIGGNTAYIDDIERSLKTLDGYDIANREAAQFTAGAQIALDRVNETTSQFRDTLLISTSSALGETSANILNEARGALDDVIGALNTDVAGRAVFGGKSSLTAPMASAQDLLAGLKTAIVGAGTVDDIFAAATLWFDDPAGYAALGYLGSDQSLSPFALSGSATESFDVRGDDPALKSVLQSIAMSVLADDPDLGLSRAQQSEVFQKTASNLIGASGDVINLQAKVGFSETRIEANIARHSTERSALEMARNDLFNIDPYETATELEQVQFQLQSLYAITSRMSQMSLVNFL